MVEWMEQRSDGFISSSVSTATYSVTSLDWDPAAFCAWHSPHHFMTWSPQDGVRWFLHRGWPRHKPDGRS